MNAVAWLKGGELHIWSGVQAPTVARDHAAEVSGIDPARVHVHTTLMGGGFGRRAESDFVVQAVRLAMALKGKPVTGDVLFCQRNLSRKTSGKEGTGSGR